MPAWAVDRGYSTVSSSSEEEDVALPNVGGGARDLTDDDSCEKSDSVSESMPGYLPRLSTGKGARWLCMACSMRCRWLSVVECKMGGMCIEGILPGEGKERKGKARKGKGRVEAGRVLLTAHRRSFNPPGHVREARGAVSGGLLPRAQGISRGWAR